MRFVDKAIEKGGYDNLVKYRKADKIRLHPDKKEMKKLFTSIIDSIPPDTILNIVEISSLLPDTAKTITPVDPKIMNIFQKPIPIQLQILLQLNCSKKKTFIIN